MDKQIRTMTNPTEEKWNTMSCNGVGTLKCQCLCQLLEHAARNNCHQ